jgi:hypothetical protein
MNGRSSTTVWEGSKMIGFCEVPPAIVARANDIHQQVVDASRGIRIFDLRVSDGLVRVTVLPRMDAGDGTTIFTWCIGHKMHFTGDAGRTPNDEEIMQAVNLIREKFPEAPQMVENTELPALFGLPVRYFVPVCNH